MPTLCNVLYIRPMLVLLLYLRRNVKSKFKSRFPIKIKEVRWLASKNQYLTRSCSSMARILVFCIIVCIIGKYTHIHTLLPFALRYQKTFWWAMGKMAVDSAWQLHLKCISVMHQITTHTTVQCPFIWSVILNLNASLSSIGISSSCSERFSCPPARIPHRQIQVCRASPLNCAIT